MRNNAFKRIFFISALLYLGCKDKTFELLPTYSSADFDQELIKSLQDSIAISKGLFYRQLTERNYSEIFGHAYLHLSDHQDNYDIVILSGQIDQQKIGLICTVDPVYNSITDVMTFHKDAHKIIDIKPSKMSTKMIDIKLLDITRLTRRPDTLLIQTNPEGILEKLSLCCDF